MIQDVILAKANSDKFCERLLIEPALTVQKVLELGKLIESADAQTKDISASKETAENTKKDIQKLRISKPKHYQHQQDNFRKTPKRKDSYQNKGNYQNKPNYQRSQSVLECSRCGIKQQHGSECRKSRDKTCRKCGKLGHFEKMCRTKINHNTNQLQVNENNVPEDEDEIYLLQLSPD